MKLTYLKIKNIGLIADTSIDINKPLLVFYGEIRQGKTTILNAVRWVCGGAFPADIIKHGEKEGSIELGFDGGSVTRSWYRGKESGEIKARQVQFVRAGKPVANPVSELKRLLNPFLLDQDFFRNMTELERSRYLTEQLGVDTTTLDTELVNNKRQAEALRLKLTGYGEIDLTPVESVDSTALRQELATVRQQHQDKLAEWQQSRKKQQDEYRAEAQSVERSNSAIREHNSRFDRSVQTFDALVVEIARLKKALEDAEAKLKTEREWQSENPKKQLAPSPAEPAAVEMPIAPDTSALEAKLQSAAAQNVLAEQFKKNVERDNLRKADETALKALEDRARQIRKHKVSALAKISENSGVAGLSFTEDGTFVFEGTQAGMLSTSQIMRLSSALSALYPDGLGVELLDRGESLGRSIFDYVTHAKEKNVSVLATVVGQRPANVPEQVGVFVVKDGVIMQEESK